MKGFQFIIEGNWGHFKKPETNNNPLSHDIIPKTALIGMIGAVLGVEREEMKNQFPKLSEDLLYGIQLLSPVKKVSWGFSSTKANSPTKSAAPKYFEFLKNPKFLICIGLKNKDSESIFQSFLQSVKNNESFYPPILGWHNCPANVEWHSEGNISNPKTGQFETKSFVSAEEHKLNDFSGGFRIGFDKIPTYQTDDFWNLPEKYINIVYPDFPHSIVAEGTYYEYKYENTEEKWFLI